MLIRPMLFGSRAPLWTPAQINNRLWTWLDPSDAATVTASGGRVSQVADKSGAGRNATQVNSGGQPALSAAAIGGRAALSFSAAAGHLMSLPSLAALSSGEMVAVVKRAQATPASDLAAGPILFASSNTTTGMDNHYPYSDGVIYDSFGSTVRKTVGKPAAGLDTAHLAGFRSAASDYVYRLNGAAFFSTTTNTVGFSSSPTIAKSIGAFYFDGLIGEMVIANTALSISDRQKLEGYLAWRWGLQGGLAADHPYKSRPPYTTDT